MKALRVVALVASAWAGTAARADDDVRYEFKQNYRDGQEFVVLFSQCDDLKFTTYVRGRAASSQSSSMTAQDKGKLTVLSTEGGVPVAERVEFDSSCGVVRRANQGEPKIEASAVAGRTVLIRRNSDGAPVADVEGAKDPKLKRLFRDWLSRDTDYYPDRPVRVGDRWDVSAKVKQRLTTSGDREQVMITCELKEVRQVKGHRLAEVKLNLAAMSHLKNGLYLELQGDGKALIDLETGRVCRMDLTGTTRASGSHGSSVNGSGDGTLEVHQLCLPASMVNRAGAGGTAAAN